VFAGKKRMGQRGRREMVSVYFGTSSFVIFIVYYFFIFLLILFVMFILFLYCYFKLHFLFL